MPAGTEPPVRHPVTYTAADAPSRVAASGSKSSGSDAIGATVDSTGTNARRSTDSSTATIVSSTW